jgi:sugar phosphate isomerase/epimerase
MRNTLLTTLLLLPLLAAAPQTHVDHPGLVKLHWQQAARASTFREMSVLEMIDLLHEMDVHHIELTPDQSLSPDKKDVKISPDLSQADIDELLAKLKPLHMDIVSYAAADFGANPEEAKKVFEFGKKLKLKTIVTDASPETLEMLDKLATEYGINVAITSDSPAKRYVTCDAALDAIKGRSNRVGVCADIEAWRKSGQDPVECVKKLASQVLVVNVSNAADESLKLGECLRILRDAGFKGICCVQDGNEDPEKRLEGFATTVNAFNRHVTALAKE